MDDDNTNIIHEICNQTPHFCIAIQVCTLEMKDRVYILCRGNTSQDLQLAFI